MVNATLTATAARRAQAIFMMGGPASGKSTIRKRDYAGIVAIDCDDIKAEHADYDEKNPNAVHEWSSKEATRRFFAVLGTGQDVVFDGTGNSAEKYVNFIKFAQAAGYETTVVLVAVDIHVALNRNAARDRVVPEFTVRERHANIAISFDIVSKYADHTVVVRND